jgi:hypothetical protein
MDKAKGKKKAKAAPPAESNPLVAAKAALQELNEPAQLVKALMELKGDDRLLLVNSKEGAQLLSAWLKEVRWRRGARRAFKLRPNAATAPPLASPQEVKKAGAANAVVLKELAELVPCGEDIDECVWPLPPKSPRAEPADRAGTSPRSSRP